MRLKQLLLLIIMSTFLWGSSGLATSVSTNALPPVNVPGADCPEPDNPDPDNPPMNGDGPNGADGKEKCCPGDDSCELDPDPTPPDPNPTPNPTPPCEEDPPYHFNPTDAPDSLPSLGERVRLEAVFGAAGPIMRWGRPIGFGSMGRLNYLSKAQVTRDFLYVRVCNPVDNSTAAFERIGDTWEYELVDGIGYDDDTKVRLENPVNGVPQSLVILHPAGSSISMDFETDAPSRQELDGLVYRVVERKTKSGHATRIAYYQDRVVITDASGHNYICKLVDDRIVEISFTVDGQTRSWKYAYDDNTYAGKDGYVTETNMQTGKKISTWLRGRLVVTDILTVGADGKKKETIYRPGGWTSNVFFRSISRTFPTLGSVTFNDSTSGTKSSRTFTAKGMIAKTDGMGKVTTFERNSQRQFTRKVDALGGAWQREYNGNRGLVKSVDPDGKIVEYSYDPAGNLSGKRVKLSATEWAEYSYLYNSQRQLVAARLPNGGEKRYIYDTDGKVSYKLEKIDPTRWSAIAYTYNGNGQMTSFSHPYEAVDADSPAAGKPAKALVITYDVWGNQTSRTDELGNTTRYEYDAGNKLTAVVDPLGHRTKYVYDSLGQLVKQTDALGNSTEWVYNGQGRATEIKGVSATPGCTSCAMASGITDRPGRYQWNVNGLLESYTDLENRTTRYDYDANRRKIRETDPLGNVTAFEYDALGRLTKLTDPLGNSTKYTHDATGRLLTTTDALGNVSRNTYDLGCRLVGIVDAAGGETLFAHDAEGRVIEKKVKVNYSTWRETHMQYNLRGDLVESVEGFGSPEAVVTCFEYDADGHMFRSVIDPDGLAIVQEYHYDPLGRLSKRIDPNGNAASFAYDAAGNMIEMISAEGRKIMFEYDEAGRKIASIVDPNGAAQFQNLVYDAAGRVSETSDGVASTSYLYDKTGLRTRVSIPGQRATNLTYDAAKRLIESKRQNDSGTVVMTTKREYDAANRVTKVIDEVGKATTYTYNAKGQVVSITNPLGAITRFEYDAAGRQTKVILPYGGERKYLYNLVGELVKTEGGPEGTREYRYDTHGRELEVIDANGRSMKTFYNAVGRVARIENEMGQAVSYAYDAAGNRLSLTDANGNASLFEYDKDGNTVKLIYPSVQGQPENIETYQYDSAGQLVRKTTPNGDCIRYRHDPAGNIAAIYYGADIPEGQDIPTAQLIAKYERDGTGAVVKEEDPLTAMLYRYDEFGRLVEVKDRTLDKAVRYAYDLRNLRNQMDVVDYSSSQIGSTSMSVAYGYDDAGRLASVKKDSDPAALYEYDLSGRRVKLTLPNGVATSYTYDSNDRLLELFTRKDANVLASFAYSMDPTGNRTDITYADGSKSVYSFDNAYRLTQDKRVDASNQILYNETFTYDSVGNRLTKNRTGWNPVDVQYAYNARNQLVSTTGSEAKTYSYDPSGNTTNIASSTGTESMTYDILNRLTRYQGPNGVEETAYRGAAWHRWFVDETPTGSIASRTAFLYDKDDVVADYIGILPVLARLYVTPELDQNLSMTMVGAVPSTYYYSQDGLGSVGMLSDAAGVVQNRYDYSAFGENRANNVSVQQRFRYTGREVWKFADSMFYRYRGYEFSNGRFASRDPLMYNANLYGNIYAFVQHNPINRKDPFGLLTDEECFYCVKDKVDKGQLDGYLKRFLSGNGSKCSNPPKYSYDCAQCGNGNHAEYMGNGNIVLCADALNGNESSAALTALIAHELGHMLQYDCYDMEPNPSNPCGQAICNEIQAYSTMHVGINGATPINTNDMFNSVFGSVPAQCRQNMAEFARIYNEKIKTCMGYIGRPPSISPPPLPDLMP